MRMLLPRLLLGAVAACSMISSVSVSGGTSWGTVTQLYARNDLIRISTTFSGIDNPDNCTNPSVYIVQQSNANADAMVSPAVTAYATGQQIKFWLHGCDASGYPIIYGLYIQP